MTLVRAAADRNSNGAACDSDQRRCGCLTQLDIYPRELEVRAHHHEGIAGEQRGVRAGSEPLIISEQEARRHHPTRRTGEDFHEAGRAHHAASACLSRLPLAQYFSPSILCSLPGGFLGRLVRPDGTVSLACSNGTGLPWPDARRT